MASRRPAEDSTVNEFKTMTETDLSIPAALSRKLDESAARFDELQRQLNDPDVLSSPAKLVPITKESGRLETLVARYRSLLKAIDGVKELQAMAAGDDAEMASMASDDLPGASAAALEQLEALKDEFVAAEDNKVDSFFLEIRAGTGGEEAALFGRDLYEMYRKYCEVNRWHFDTSDYSVSERGGFKEVIVNIKGTGAYRHMQFEGGGHRVQRVPETEAQGRIHTSAATVAVVPEMPGGQIDINPKDVEEFGCRGGGPGGQNVNKVETGWFIRHKPSGVSFKMTEHKSQTQNKERAWALLRAMLYETERAKQHAEVTGLRKSQMGSGDRSQRIRTYNFPQNRCTDHRLGGEGGGEKNFNLDKVMQGELQPIVASLLEMDKRERLEAV